MCQLLMMHWAPKVRFWGCCPVAGGAVLGVATKTSTDSMVQGVAGLTVQAAAVRVFVSTFAGLCCVCQATRVF
jgi:hypothetical protein